MDYLLSRKRELNKAIRESQEYKALTELKARMKLTKEYIDMKIADDVCKAMPDFIERKDINHKIKELKEKAIDDVFTDGDGN